MKRAVSAVVAVALLIGAFSLPEFPPFGALRSGSLALEAAAEPAGSSPAPAVSEDGFNWNGVWQYSASEQWNVGSNNPYAGAAVYKTVNVTETLAISPYAKLEGYSYKAVWDTETDDGETVAKEEKIYLATTSLYEGSGGKTEMILVPFDGTNVDEGYNSFRLLYETDAGDVYSTDFGKTYARIGEGPSMKKELAISGALRGVDGKPLPRMKVDLEVYYDVASMPAKWEDGLPDLHESLAADLDGTFSAKIPIRGDVQTVIGVVITLTLRCALPQGDAYFLTDCQDPNALDGIRVSTLATVDPSDASFQDGQEIPVSRALPLYNAALGFLTFDDAMNQEPMQTNLGDTMKFLGYSYVYRLLWDALTVGGIALGELPALMQSPTGNPLRIDCNYKPDPNDPGDRSHYSATKNAIRLTADRCGYDDVSRFTVLHEFGHFFDAATNGWKARCSYAARIASGDLQHGGYLNSGTADSFVEGFASWYACVCQLYRKDAKPYMFWSWNLYEPGENRAWQNGGTEEEFSIASVLIRAMVQFDSAEVFWKDILRTDEQDFYGYYAMIRFALGKNSGKMALVNRYFRDAALFRMPSGNGQYDPGEPYRDLNKDGQFTPGGEPYTDVNGNGKYDPPEPFEDEDGDKQFDAADEPYTDANGDGQYDFGEFYDDLDGSGNYSGKETFTDANGDGVWTPGEAYQDMNGNKRYDPAEPYGDLMYPYDASAGTIDTSAFPASFNSDAASLGESAAYNYPDRRSIVLRDNCFLALSGEVVGALKVAVRLTDGASYAYVATPTDRGIYVGLPGGDHEGSVEVSVPGGKAIYRGDVRALQARMAQTIGQSVPLDSVSILGSDLAPAGTIAAPTGGDPDASGVFTPVELSNQEAAILAGHYDPDAQMSEMPDVRIPDAPPDAGEEGSNPQNGEPEGTPGEGTQPDSGHTPQEDTGGAAAIVDVAAGEYFTLGLRQDGTVVAAGDDEYGQCDVGGWTDVVAIAAGLQHSVGLRRDGTVLAAGDDELGQCDVQGWEDIVAVSAGYGHTVGLKSDGTVVAAGYNGDGQCNVSAWRGITAIAAGGWHTIGLKDGGTAVAAGYNKYGQCNVKKWSGIARVAAGGWHTIGIKGNGRVVSAGYADSGQCDVGGWRAISMVSASGYHTVGLCDGGAVFATGNDNFGQCEIGEWENVVRIAAGGYHTVATLRDGSVVAIGNDEYGQCEIAAWGAAQGEPSDGYGE